MGGVALGALSLFLAAPALAQDYGAGGGTATSPGGATTGTATAVGPGADADGTGAAAYGNGANAGLNNASSGDTAIGWGARAEGVDPVSGELGRATAVGSSAEVDSYGGTALGEEADVGTNSGGATALGQEAHVHDDAEHSTAIGYFAEVFDGAVDSNAMGSHSKVMDGVDNAVALGSWSIATEANTISVGSSIVHPNDPTKLPFTRQITNVSAGDLVDGSTDAVNADQLFDEQTARQAADITLQTNINNEAAARQAADVNLQAQIDEIPIDWDNTSGRAISDAAAQDSTAVGYGAVVQAGATDGVALGAATVEAAAINSVAIGNGSVASEANTFSVGAAGNERRVVNVADGEISATSTDAVNGSQLHGIVANFPIDSNDTLNRGAPTASAADSLAVGNGAVASHAGSTAIGMGAVTTDANQVAVGRAGQTYEFAGLGDGATTRLVTADASGTLGTTSMSALFDPIADEFFTHIENINYNIGRNYNRLSKRINGGVAAAMALPQGHMPSVPGRSSWAVSTAVYGNRAAAGASFTHRFNTEKPTALRVGLSYGGYDKLGAVVAAFGEF